MIKSVHEELKFARPLAATSTEFYIQMSIHLNLTSNKKRTLENSVDPDQTLIKVYTVYIKYKNYIIINDNTEKQTRQRGK